MFWHTPFGLRMFIIRHIFLLCRKFYMSAFYDHLYHQLHQTAKSVWAKRYKVFKMYIIHLAWAALETCIGWSLVKEIDYLFSRLTVALLIRSFSFRQFAEKPCEINICIWFSEILSSLSSLRKEMLTWLFLKKCSYFLCGMQ